MYILIGKKVCKLAQVIELMVLIILELQCRIYIVKSVLILFEFPPGILGISQNSKNAQYSRRTLAHHFRTDLL